MIARIRNLPSCATLSAIVLGAMAFMGSPAPATVLVPDGDNVTTPGLASLAGLIQQDTETVPFFGQDVFDNTLYAGYLISNVYYDPSTRAMDFTYQVVATTGYSDAIRAVSVSAFGDYPPDAPDGYTVDADYVSDLGEVAYDLVNLSSMDSGGTISLDYSTVGGIAPGDTTDVVLVKTNASWYDNYGGASFSDDGSANIVAFEPAGTPVVPEPMSLGLLALGAVICATRRPRRQI
jgi:hypothetical protein